MGIVVQKYGGSSVADATSIPAIEIREQGQKEGMITLRRSGCRKILDGMTTIEEIIRETVL